MNAQHLPILLLVVSFAFLLRLTFTTGETRDEWVSFWHIARQKHSKWLNYQVDDSILSGVYSYPVLPHFLVSRFPQRLWGIAGRGLNAFCDVLTALIVYGVTHQLSINLFGSSVRIAGLELELIATLLFLTTPILLPVTARLRTIKARSMGLTVTTLFFVTLGIAHIDGDWRILIVSIGLGLLIILTSMFALQVMIGFSLFLSLYLLSAVPIVVVFVVLSLGYFMPKLGTNEAIRFFWHHKVWYRRNYSRQTTAANRNRVKDILWLPVYVVNDFGRFIHLLFREITPIILLYSAPIAFLTAMMWILGGPRWNIVENSAILEFLWGLTLASFACFVLTSFRPFGFLGQAERYLEYSAPAYSIVFSILLTTVSEPTKTNLVWLLLFFHLTAVCANFLFMHRPTLKRAEPIVKPPLQEVINWFSENLRKARIATVPCKLGFVLSANRLQSGQNNLKYYYRFILREGEQGFRYYEEDTGGYVATPFGKKQSFDVFRASPAELRNKYGVTHLLIERSYVRDLEQLYQSWSLTHEEILTKTVFENTAYLICEI